MDYTAHSYRELQACCKERGLKAAGKKAFLLESLQSHDAGTATASFPPASAAAVVERSIEPAHESAAVDLLAVAAEAQSHTAKSGGLPELSSCSTSHANSFGSSHTSIDGRSPTGSSDGEVAGLSAYQSQERLAQACSQLRPSPHQRFNSPSHLYPAPEFFASAPGNAASSEATLEFPVATIRSPKAPFLPNLEGVGGADDAQVQSTSVCEVSSVEEELNGGGADVTDGESSVVAEVEPSADDDVAPAEPAPPAPMAELRAITLPESEAGVVVETEEPRATDDPAPAPMAVEPAPTITLPESEAGVVASPAPVLSVGEDIDPLPAPSRKRCAEQPATDAPPSKRANSAPIVRLNKAALLRQQQKESRSDSPQVSNAPRWLN